LACASFHPAHLCAPQSIQTKLNFPPPPLTKGLLPVLLCVAVASQAMAQTVFFVDANTPASNPLGIAGWPDAFSNLQPALQVADEDDTILVAEGTYYPDTNDPNCVVSIDLVNAVPTSRNYSFVFRKPTTVIGGYKGNSAGGSGSIDPDAPDGQATSTILSGDLTGTPSNYFDNSYHVVHVDGLTSTLYATYPAVIERLNIQYGNAFMTPPGVPNSSMVGAGIYCRNAVLELSTVNVSNCWADDSGAAIYVTDGALRAKICVIRNNVARGHGAGIMLLTPQASPSTRPDGWDRLSQLHNIQFLDNTAEGGAGLSAQGPFPSWSDQNSSHPGLSIANCLFARNKALWGGGAQIVLSGNSADNRVHMNNCTFTENVATQAASPNFQMAGYGGGLFVWDQLIEPIGNFFLHNSILKFNKGRDSNGAQIDSNLNIAEASSALLAGSINHCDIGPHLAGWLHNPVWANLPNVVDADPSFEGPGIGNYRLNPSSPCVNKGNDFLLSRDYLDLDGNDVRMGEQVPRDLDHYTTNSNVKVREYDFPNAVPFTGILGVDAGNVGGAITDLGCYERKPYVLPSMQTP
jgi:hypothetical protein